MGCMDKNDHATVRAVLSGDKDAYGALVAHHSRSIYRVAYRITGNDADAEEVVQDAFLRGYRKLEGFESRSNFAPWSCWMAGPSPLDRISRHGDKNERANARADADSEAV